MKVRAYYAWVQKAVLAEPGVIRFDVAFDEVAENEGYISGKMLLTDQSELHFSEYVITEPDVQRLKYRYHLQSAEKKLLARWDNAPHHPEVSSHPHHLHLADSVKESEPMDIQRVLRSLVQFL